MKSVIVLLVGVLILAVLVFAMAAGARPRAAKDTKAGPVLRVRPGWAMPAPAPAAGPAGGGVAVVEPPARVMGPAPPRPGGPAVVQDNAAAAPAVVQNNAAAAPGAADMFAAWGPPPAPALDTRRFSEAHWQGLELIPKTAAVAKALGLPEDLQGVIVDDVSLPADLQGFQAGDVVTRVGVTPTPNLTVFVTATDQLRELPSATLEIFRDGTTRRLELTGLMGRLGTANGETPTMILSGARPPHGYLGPCTGCHRVGSTGSLATDQGDPTTKTAPKIRAGSVRPHRDRGTCTACHQILP